MQCPICFSLQCVVHKPRSVSGGTLRTREFPFYVAHRAWLRRDEDKLAYCTKRQRENDEGAVGDVAEGERRHEEERRYEIEQRADKVESRKNAREVRQSDQDRNKEDEEDVDEKGR